MSESVLVSTDPHDGSVVGEIAASTPEQVRAAVARARAAQPAWAALPFEERAEALLAALPRLEEAAEELGQLVHREMGKPLAQAVGEAKGSARALKDHVELARKAVASEHYREGDVETVVRHDPLGVVAVITPWNFPLWMAASLVQPALAVGNTVVHKPSEKTPLAGQRQVEILASALPQGVLEPLVGAGDVGRLLVDSDVDMVAFVGSQDTGRAIMGSCAKGLKRLVLELGGKDPMIVLADADLEKAAQHAAHGAFRNSGQVCVAVERILVERPAAEELTRRVAEIARTYEIGPMADETQLEKVRRQVDDARARGARVLVGGEPTAGPGCWYPPTVVAGVTDDMEMARRETFGPVAAIRVVESAEEAVRLANDTEYGLGATVWTGDPERGQAIAARLQAGMIGVNRGIGGVGDAPWVGARGSGFGYVGSVDGTRQFTQVRTITRSVGG
jgi:acyl-CoA reductase-like NAD-dependent aldehyde dehydrogenase